MAYCFSKFRSISIAGSAVGLLITGCSTHTVIAPSPTPSVAQSSATPTSTPSAPNPSLSSATPSASVEPTLDPDLINDLRKKLSNKVAIAKQDTGRTYLGILLLSQQAEKLVKGKFTSDLKQLASDTPIDTEEYRLEVREADAAKAVMVAIAKKPGFASYTGAVYAVEGNIPVTGMCRTNVPSQVPPAAPKFTYSTILCEQGSSKVN
jgi:Type IV pilin-like G and H, putative